ncbi:MAG: SMC-Scp complex subunit ScpB [Lachnospiraceae bacterium]|jgi:segregation and condensation protein B|nr:SMC-Scp complex subunit ScpB [Lachnospiraceae bacterium]
MEIREAKTILEAVLFAMGGAVGLKSLAEAIGQDEETTRKLVQSLADDYDGQSRGMKIIELEGAFQMCTRTEYYENLIRVTAQPRKYVLTEVLLETLSIIAYKQPVTKPEIEKIRGVKSDHAVNKLIEYGLVEEVGRLNVPGRPLLFGTTEDFLRSFGVSSLEELPVTSQEQIEEFKAEAEEEAQLTLEI